jgi:hypothetical protein
MNEMLDVISMFDHDGAIIENSSYGCPPFQNELGMAGANVKEIGAAIICCPIVTTYCLN